MPFEALYVLRHGGKPVAQSTDPEAIKAAQRLLGDGHVICVDRRNVGAESSR